MFWGYFAPYFEPLRGEFLTFLDAQLSLNFDLSASQTPQDSSQKSKNIKQIKTHFKRPQNTRLHILSPRANQKQLECWSCMSTLLHQMSSWLFSAWFSGFTNTLRCMKGISTFSFQVLKLIPVFLSKEKAVLTYKHLCELSMNKRISPENGVLEQLYPTSNHFCWD